MNRDEFAGDLIISKTVLSLVGLIK